MECTCDIDTKKSLDKAQDNGPHHDNRDIGEHKEENSSYHSFQIIQKLRKSQVLYL